MLGTEFGVGVRNGCFCAHPYLTHLLGLTQGEGQQIRVRIAAGDRTAMPGMVRVSFGSYNTFDEVDALAEALGAIARGEYRGTYTHDRASGGVVRAGVAAGSGSALQALGMVCITPC